MRNFTYLFLVALLLSVPLEAQKRSFAEKISSSQESLKILVIGGSLSSGVQAGGINKQFQAEAFPNLIARQLRSNAFAVPDFQPSQTVKVTEDDYGIPIFEKVPSQHLSGSEGTIYLNSIPDLNNLAVPFQKVFGIYAASANYLSPYLDTRSFDYLSMMKNNDSDYKDSSYWNIVETKSKDDFDFFVYELGFDDFVAYLLSGGYRRSIDYMVNMERMLENELIGNMSQNSSGVILNVPDPRDLPFFNILNISRLEGLTSSKDLYIKEFENSQIRKLDEKDLILFNSELYESLIDNNSPIGRKYESALMDKDVLTYSELGNVQIKSYNKKLAYIASVNKLPVTDLYSLYKLILEGKYVTHDGVQIDPSFPGGNFFSADGIFPSSLGQRVICNEIISTLNNFYGIKLDYLPTENK